MEHLATVVSERALEGARTTTETSQDAVISGTVPAAKIRRNNTLAILTLIFSLLGVGVVGLVLGHLARGQIRRTGEPGAGTALAGMIIGYVEVAAMALVGVLFLILALASLG